MGFASKREGYQPTCEAKVELRMQCISHMYVRDKVEELSSCRFGVNEACKGEVGGFTGEGVSLTGAAAYVAADRS